MVEWNRFTFRSVKGVWWDLDRFGLTPARLARRLRPKKTSRICLISMPKSGTHFIERLLIHNQPFYRRLIPTLHANILKRNNLKLADELDKTRSGQIVVAHFQFDQTLNSLLSEKQFKKVLMIRHPFDVFISWVRFLKTNKKHRQHHRFAGLSDLEIARLLLDGDASAGIVPLLQRMEAYLGWTRQPDVFVCRFEDIRNANEQTAGDQAHQLFAFLGIQPDRSMMKTCIENAHFEHSLTFRKPDGLNKSDELKELFFSYPGARSLIENFGYRVL